MKKINVALVGIGSVSASLVEGLAYQSKISSNAGVMIPKILGYNLRDIKIVCGFDIAKNKVNQPISNAIYAKQNIFIKNKEVKKSDVKNVAPGIVYQGKLIEKLDEKYVKMCGGLSNYTEDIKALLYENKVDVLVNLIPTGLEKSAVFYANNALDCNIAFVNGIPAKIFRDQKIRREFVRKNIPIFGDDIKSQLGTTLIHRTLLNTIKSRGGVIENTSQINIGGNMDFMNLENNSYSKMESKYYALSSYSDNNKTFVKNIYNSLKGPLKDAFIEVNLRLFNKSKINIKIMFTSDDKSNAAGCIVDLIRFAKALKKDKLTEDKLNLVSSLYMKSPKTQLDEAEVYYKLSKIARGQL